MTDFDPDAALESLRAEQRTKQYGQPLDQLETFGQSLGDTLTFGGLSLAERALTNDPEAMRQRQEAQATENPWSHGLGMAGAIGLGGLGGAAEASAPALISKAGKALSGGVEGLLGRALSKGVATAGEAALTKGAAGLAGGALEGGLYGLGNVAHEAALGDPNLTAQKAISEVGLSAALGGGLSGAMGAAEVGLPLAVSKAKGVFQDVFNKGEGALGAYYKAAEPITGTPADVATLMLEHRAEITGLDKMVPGMADEISNATPSMAKWMVDNGGRLEEMEKAFPGTSKQLARTSPETADYLLNNWQKIITDPQARVGIAKNLAKGMQDVVDSTNSVMRRINTELAPQEAEALLQGHTGETTQLAYAKLADEVQGAIGKMRAEPELYGQGYARQLEGIRDGILRDVEVSANPVEAFKRMKVLRQSLDEAIPYTKDMGALGISERNALKVMKDIRGKVKGALTDEAVFGQAAARQSALDDAQREWFALTKRGGDFNTKFMRKEMGAGGVSYSLKPTKLNTWLNQMADARGQDFADTWGRTMDAARKLVDEAEKSHHAAPTSVFDRKGLEAILKKSEEMTADARQAAAVTQVKNQLDPRMSWGSMPISSMPGMVEKAAHMLLPGALTSTVKGTLSLATSVPKSLAALSMLERVGKSVGKRIDSGVEAMMRGARAGRPTGSALAAGAVHSVEQKITRVSDLAQNPATLQDALTRQTDAIHEHAPDTSNAMQVASARGVSFLQSKLPKQPPPTPLGKRPPLPEHEKWAFARYYDAVDRPTSILDHAAQGTLLPMDVEAVRTVFPQLYAEMQKATLDKLTSHKEPLPYRSSLMVSMIMGQDMDGTLGQKAIEANQMAYALPSSRSGDDMAAPRQPGAVRPSQTGLGKLKVSNRASLPGQSRDARMGET